jgi:hypothetical protein
MKRKIVFAIFCIGILSTGAIFDADLARSDSTSTSTMTDQQLDAVLGGLDCHYCGSNDDGCAEGWETGNCDYEQDEGECDGAKQDTCEQAQKVCKEDVTLATCSNSSSNCTAQYYTYSCVKDSYVDDETGETVYFCRWEEDQMQPLECGGKKSWC